MTLRKIEGPISWAVPRARRVRDLLGLLPRLGAIGSLELRLATTKKEIRQAQKLRYHVFFEERGIVPDPTARLIRRDICAFDRVCDHLIVFDHAALSRTGAPKVVGAYRLLRQDVATANFGFYSASEFDIAPLLERHPGKRFLELGRSCVAPGYRGKPTLELLWRGVWTYAQHHRVDAMFGCASFDGSRPAEHSVALDCLRRTAMAGPEWSVRAMQEQVVDVTPAALEAIDARAAVRALPPLIKGYWRVGAKFCAEAVVDPKFATTDVFVIMPIVDIEERYIRYFSIPGEAAPLAA
jgi:L-ornithine Nalpha-acyltransferase